ncbi:DMT family transporter [Allokutzneria albata]|uniref:Permease of the drug/metabolite transporter (DMT) superfamily n=1 Tax=Allokutzneria albata TaxID=211114 RepID=A0A1G9YMG0_ALLAB|nr:DMT family transporter [Allokutzneria albata]SDN10280.1 Permease of the drug/metabolite transporter (DMT) superfamily [Allokutzneria albata]
MTRSRTSGVLAGVATAVMLGSMVPVTALLADYPLFPGQAVRYAIAAVLLLGFMVVRRRPLPRPSLRDVFALTATAATGMVGFSAAVLYAQQYAEGGFVAAVIGGSPLVIAIVAPLLTRQRPVLKAVAGAALVVVGVVILSGGGAWHGPGLVLALLAMFGEAAFTLFAVGVIARLGVVAVSAYSCVVAAVGSAVISFWGSWPMPTSAELFAILFLAVMVTAVAFVVWYYCVSVLGAANAAVMVGLVPVFGLLATVALGQQELTVVAVLGAVVVATGCVIGLRASRTPPPVSDPHGPCEERPELRPAVPR